MKKMIYYAVLAIVFFTILGISSLVYVLVFPNAKSPSYAWLLITFFIFMAITPRIKKLMKIK